MTALMWNHGPAMWRAMAARNLAVPPIEATEIADLFAYFYAIRYFDRPGDAARGKVLFSDKKCSICHSLTPTAGKGPGPPVSQWPAIANRIRWSEHMWNHSGAMMTEMEKKGIPWPTFTLQEMVDLLVYLRNLPDRLDELPSLIFEDPVEGEKIFQGRGCGQCHSVGEAEPGKIDLVGAARAARTFTELGVSMWNHLPQMRRRAAATRVDFPTLSENEMSQLIAYLFAKRYFEEKGNRRRGRAVFSSRKCGTCHDQPGSGAPSLQDKRGRFSAPQMASAVWQHGPRMMAEMEKRGIRWPTFSGDEMAGLIAFLNTR